MKLPLTVPAMLTGAGVGVAIYAGGGLTGLAMMIVFFLLGTIATSWKKERKIDVRAHAGHQSTRTTGQVLANAGVAGFCGLANLVIPGHHALWQLGIAGCFAAAAADTMSSELGMVYGRRFFNIMTGRRDQKGLDGVVSIEGIVIGGIAAATIAAVFVIGTGWNLRLFLVIVLAGLVGNWVDSVLGAVFERKGLLSNNVVNFLNTLAGALFAGWASYGL